mmetsp:Transcript_9228/g.25825  ORF Transcript_9228/g.25825 Transcript_9228/m.25825 type:complete len:258 (+) Transcript_9228:53-826(+)
MHRGWVRRAIQVQMSPSRVATLSICRPPVNAFNRELMQSLRATLLQVQGEASAVVLASGLRCFCGGLDLTTFTQPRNELLDFWGEVEETWRTLYMYPLPTVAAVNGSSPAWGCIMALSCDHRVMTSSRRAIIGLNEAAIGIPPSRWMEVLLERVVGFREAERLLLSGMLPSAPEAHRLGLVDELCQPEAVHGVALRRAEELCRATPPKAYAETKAKFRSWVCDLSGPETVRAKVDAVMQEECQSAVKAQLERLRQKC